jgi:DNA polymerase
VASGTALEELRAVAEARTACRLYRDAPQVVFGAGPAFAPMMRVGEQPGDAEDLEGEPFVGPVALVLAAAGIPIEDIHLTSVVRHFRWKPKSKKRLHRTPATRHDRARLPWLEAELAMVEPRVTVCLDAVASQALLGKSFRVAQDHDKVPDWDGYKVVATVHPSSALGAVEPEERKRLWRTLAGDLGNAFRLIR